MSIHTLSKAARRGAFLAILATVALTGCGSDEPDRYNVSGTVTFDGKPVPAGQIYFMPDGAKGNKGAAGFAQIKDGKFNTKLEGGKGHVSGPMIVRIEGQDPSGSAQKAKGDTSGEEVSKSLFPTYEISVELPKEDTTKDFPVPAEAAKKKITSETNMAPGGV